MKKLLEGLLDFQRHTLPAYRATFARLATSQKPDCLFISCADSRVVPNLFASTNPGDLFVVRNVATFVPPAGPDGAYEGDDSVGAAIEFAVDHLKVGDIVVCGHSHCGAMKALLGPDMPGHLGAWLRHGRDSVARLDGNLGSASLEKFDQLSQANVLAQVNRLRGYPSVARRVAAGDLRLHAWWFDIGEARVYAYEPADSRFVQIDEAEGRRMIARLEQGLPDTVEPQPV